ncbi:hypothetical protein Q9251_02905 [Alkalihalobacillus macyae]|uniref:hypothetical protein n=1 Tax=Guptibacillus hwajinpoensis TaxID=208199 RepID=UPI00273B39CE|nr:hypothetical protein [Alkalihalobacillus macyae]MDP4549824.1 hypothetical protein [Alkalihalobacillus macyae]
MIKAFAYVKFHQDIPSGTTYADSLILDKLDDIKDLLSFDYSSLQVSKIKRYNKRTYVDVEGFFIFSLDYKEGYQIDDYVSIVAPTAKHILRIDSIVYIHVYNIVNFGSLPFVKV